MYEGACDSLVTALVLGDWLPRHTELSHFSLVLTHGFLFSQWSTQPQKLKGQEVCAAGGNSFGDLPCMVNA